MLPSNMSRQRHRVLIIEDDEDTGLMLRYILELVGQDVRLARSGRSGLLAAKLWRPDIVISDLGLPGEMDGCDVARALRANQQFQSAYLVALSGHGRNQDKVRARAAGFDQYLVKPIDLETLERVIADASRSMTVPASQNASLR
jgi:DNA-binding response OmpR family regulator